MRIRHEYYLERVATRQRASKRTQSNLKVDNRRIYLEVSPGGTNFAYPKAGITFDRRKT